MKRIFDFFLALLLLIIFSPIMAWTAFLIRIRLGEPILFKQLRPGMHGKTFLLYKFRTMTDEKDGNGQLKPDEERLTSYGLFLRRYSIDELPQLFNVLKGDLSIVGPRPLLMEYLPLYTEEQMQRHLVKPGITGWAQVNGRNAISWEEKFKLDIWYVHNQSFALDIKILFRTIVQVFRREGINQPGHATVELFKGSNPTEHAIEEDRQDG